MHPVVDHPPTYPSPVQFANFNSFVDPAFWTQLTKLKLHEFKLDDVARNLWGYYNYSDAPGVPCRHSVDFGSLNVGNSVSPANNWLTYGCIVVTNTLEEFANYDKVKFLSGSGEQAWDAIKSGSALDDASLLNRFVLLCFIDVKKFCYHYWFGYPALCYPDKICLAEKPKKIVDIYSNEQISSLQHQICEHLRSSKAGFFLIVGDGLAGDLAIASLSALDSSDCDYSNISLGFCDPSTLPENPGWPLRNAIALFVYQGKKLGKLSGSRSVKVLCFRNRFDGTRVNCDHSLLLNVSFDVPESDNVPITVGWEKNEKGHKAPRFLDLSPTMDPTKLAVSAVNLNLELMRWRLVPDLNLKLLSELRVLLLGSGTLGCNIARNLLGWGIHRLTFVDNGTVSFSNPVRQSLFQFEDCLEGGRHKADAVVENIKKIYPRADVTGIRLTIPMPGHLIQSKDSDECIESIKKLESLVQNNDVIFMLTDTRESRWLPTLLAAAYRKVAFSVALGFDSYVVVRHGFGCPDYVQSHPSANPDDPSSSGDCGQTSNPGPQSPRKVGHSVTVTGDQLACYFCSDVVAPGDSTHDRTLDQQCTVTRPGVSSIAAALAVEVMVSMCQHPLGAMAQADSGEATSPGSPLGHIPHQLRGFLSRFEQIAPVVRRFGACTACSPPIVAQYRESGHDFLLQAINDPRLLERITGLDELQKNTENVDILELSDSESISSSV